MTAKDVPSLERRRLSLSPSDRTDEQIRKRRRCLRIEERQKGKLGQILATRRSFPARTPDAHETPPLFLWQPTPHVPHEWKARVRGIQGSEALHPLLLYCTVP
jgi:hypothetical protein